MFAYSGNNPVMNVDQSGAFSEFFIGLFKILYTFYRLHQAVQLDIQEKYSYMNIVTEVTVTRENGKSGRMDLYSNGCVWEVKHHTLQDGARAQAMSYLRATITSRKIDTGKTVQDLGSVGAFSGECKAVVLGVEYTLKYWTPEAGVVLYSIIDKKEQKQTQYATSPVPATAPSTEKQYSGGPASIPVPIPVFIPIGGFIFAGGSAEPWTQQIK